jgi:hypothetical protein
MITKHKPKITALKGKAGTLRKQLSWEKIDAIARETQVQDQQERSKSHKQQTTDKREPQTKEQQAV